MIHHNDFENEESAKDWSHPVLNSCKDGVNYFLGGHCNFATEEISKKFVDLPKHS